MSDYVEATWFDIFLLKNQQKHGFDKLVLQRCQGFYLHYFRNGSIIYSIAVLLKKNVFVGKTDTEIQSEREDRYDKSRYYFRIFRCRKDNLN